MKNAIIVHGRPGKEEYYSDQYPSSSNFHWIPWLQKQLMIKDIKADTPEMPHAYAPDWQTWKTEFERFPVTSETILVGHSNGGGFLVRWLSENKNVKAGKVVLVAPSFNEGDHTDGTFFDFAIDNTVVDRVQEIVIFNGKLDSQSVHESVQKIMDTLPNTTLVEFPDKGHFVLDDMESETFPELLAKVVK